MLSFNPCFVISINFELLHTHTFECIYLISHILNNLINLLTNILIAFLQLATTATKHKCTCIGNRKFTIDIMQCTVEQNNISLEINL